MNTNKYEFDSTDEMLKLSDVHFDQNVPVQGPEAQALEAQGPENQAPEDQAPEALQLAAHGSVMPSMAQLQEGKSSADINFDQNHPDQAPSVGPVVTEGSDDSSGAFAQLLMVGMSPDDAKNAMMDEKLAKSALSDPINVKRKWENRQSVAGSRKRKAERKAKLETQVNTLRTQGAALVDREDLCKKDEDALKHEITELRSNVEAIQKQNLLLYLRKADQADPNSGPPGMMMPFGVRHNNFALNSGPPGMMMPFGVRHNNFALNSGPPGMMMPFGVRHNNFAPNSGPPGMMMPFGVRHNNFAPNSGPPGTMMPFGVRHNNFAPNSRPPGMMMPFGVRHNNFAPNSGPPGMMMPFGVPHNNYALSSGPPGMMMPFGVPHNNYALSSGPPGMMMSFRAPHNNYALIPYQQAAQAHAMMQQQQQTRLVPPRRTLMLLEGADASGSDAEGVDDVPGQGP